MSFMAMTGWLGVRLWIWIYLFLSFFGALGIVSYFYREKIRKKFYEIKSPEKLIKVILHYKNGAYKEFWRLIPDEDNLSIDGKTYSFKDKRLIKDNEIFSTEKSGKLVLTIEGKDYQLDQKYNIKNRWKNYPEIHYFNNVPTPIHFDKSIDEINITSKDMDMFKENDLFKKLLTMQTEITQTNILMLLVGINCLISGFILAHMMEWI